MNFLRRHKIVLIVLIFLSYMFVWWLSGYGFERSPDTARKFLVILMVTAMTYYALKMNWTYEDSKKDKK